LLKLSSQETVVEFKNVSKFYKTSRIFDQGFKGYLLNFHKNLFEKSQQYVALSEINLQIKKGEFVGLIGRNGAGKSTTLGLIAKVIHPSKGEMIIKGRVAPLLELGAGFHSDLTGRENIRINGVLLGLTRKEVEKRMDDIIEFSGLNEFIDQPMRTYSTGMYMRLGFSVAVNIDPEILLVDEVLAVGDEQFQQKCIKKMQEFKEKGTTIVFVSHDLTTAEKVCDRIAYLEKGKLISVGTPAEVIQKYKERAV